METTTIKAAEVRRNLFYKLPKWLIKEPAYYELADSAKIVYAVLHDRNALSVKNGWTDANGDVFCMYKEADIATEIGKSLSTVKRALRELSAYKLIKKVRQGLGKPNRIYLLMPSNPSDDQSVNSSFYGFNQFFTNCFFTGTFQLFDDLNPYFLTDPDRSFLTLPDRSFLTTENEKLPNGFSETNTMRLSVSETERPEAEKKSPTPSQLFLFEASHVTENNLYGEYATVSLTESEYEALVKEFGKELTDDYIARIDIHQASKGKQYKNHQATVKEWIRLDRKQITDAKAKTTAIQESAPKKKTKFNDFKQREYSSEFFEFIEMVDTIKSHEKHGPPLSESYYDKARELRQKLTESGEISA